MISKSARLFLLLAAACLTAHAQNQTTLSDSKYLGWSSDKLSNGLVDVQVVPEIGGRIMQYTLGKKEFLWVNPKLAGKSPSATGLAGDGGWLNYGGDKLWPAPQGWDNDQQWPGPPDAVLDGQPYKLKKLKSVSGETALQLESRKDQRSGIQFSRVVRIFDGSTRVSFDATMTNIDNKPRRWGIWAHTQLNAANHSGTGFNDLLNAWCPLNPASKLPGGYSVIFGDKDNPSYQTDPIRKLMRVQYQYRVGKIGLNANAGWSATVDGASGSVFVQKFVYEQEKEYPDGSSVEYWLNGKGKFNAYHKENVMASDPAENPYVMESEVLSPFAELAPGKSYTWHYDWYSANIGGDFPVVDCTVAGVSVQPLRAVASAGNVALKGRYGVFAEGSISAEFNDAAGKSVKTISLNPSVSPLRPVVQDTLISMPSGAGSVKLILIDKKGNLVGELGSALIENAEAGGKWTTERANRWYRNQPWLAGCNFLPSTAVNDVEMWQAESFDAATIDKELGWAQKTGYNSVRVFINYVVWEADPAGLRKRFDQFLQIASRHGIYTMPILLDDCFKQNPKVGKQEEPVPGVHNSQWVASPGKPFMDNKSNWPKLEAYVKDMVSTFASDPRVVIWDLYNEPTPESAELAESCLAWGRQVQPVQPLTIGAWDDLKSPFSRHLMEMSDIVSFHGYDATDGVMAKLDICSAYKRPVICTEWLIRREGNSIETLLPIFHDRMIGCWNWGFVAGRMQTYYPWGSPKGAPEPKQWQHDILRKDGSPYRIAEVELIRKLTGKNLHKSSSSIEQLDFTKNEYSARREKLMNQIPDGIAILRGAPTPAGDNLFYQYTNMMYFTGMEIPNLILVIDGQTKTSTIFITLDEDGAKNEGIPYELVQDPGKFNGIENMLPYEQFTPWLTARTEKCHTLYTTFKSEELPADISGEKSQSLKNSMTKDEWDGRLTRELQFVEQLKKKFPSIEVKDSWSMISDLRKYKSKGEIDMMREAGRIGRIAHLAFIQATGVGVKEIDLANLFENTCKTNGAMELAYYTIIMSAENIPYGHYHGYNRTLQDGDFVVLDAGPDYNYYGVDFSTSFPANGKFTPKQRELYELANAIREVCVNSYKPGITLKMVGQNVKKYLTDNGYDPAEPRFRGLITYGGYNHSVGMAVHDDMGTFKGADEVLQEGFVFACDINMMYPDIEIGVRLEDTVVITGNGCEVLSAGLPRKASEMEKAMKKQ